MRRAAQLRYCPDCGAEGAREEDPVCDGCGAPSHERFNGCFSCGESFGEANAPEEGAAGYVLDFDCDARACTGQVAAHMAYCPWCGVAQRWEREEEDADCGACAAVLEATWAFCGACGTEAPLPEQCASCTQDLEAASYAARCEACRQLVCDACFVPSTLPSAAVRGELLLCAGCVEQLGAVPVAEEDETEEAQVPAEPAAEEADDAEAPVPEDAEGFDPAREARAAAQARAAAARERVSAARERAEAARARNAAAQEATRARAEAAQAEAEASQAETDAQDEDVEPGELAPAEEPSPWEVLGVAPGTPLPEVKRAYLQLVAQYHPDKVAQLGPKLQRLALEETRKLNLAWSALRERAG